MAKLTLDDVVVHFEQLEDPRSAINLKHPLSSVLVISLLAVLAGAEGPSSIRQWAEDKEELLLSLLDLPHGIPSRDVFRRVLMSIDPQAFQACFMSWVATLREQNVDLKKGERPVLAIDGKSLRRSHDHSKGLGAMHLVSVWLTDVGMTLAQVPTDEKSNEITAIPELLKLVNIRGAIITIDAMGTQTAIAEQIVDARGDYILALKKNHSKLHDAIIEYVNEHVNDNFACIKKREFITDETGHGRHDVRTYYQFPLPKKLRDEVGFKKLKTIGVALSRSEKNGTETVDVRYFISSLKQGVKQLAKAIHSHWQIENSCHWSLDVTYREDESRTRHRKLAENFAWLRRFTLSLLKQYPGKQSLIMKRRICGWNDTVLLQVLYSTTT